MFYLRHLGGMLIIVVVALALNAGTAEAGPEGRYNISGANPGGGGTYRGTVRVTARGDAFDVTWRIGGQRYSGIGVFDGKVLSVAYYGSNLTGVAVYKAQTDGSFRGVWAVRGSGRLGAKNWVPR